MTSEVFLSERQRLAFDLHRPQYHFLPPSNWMNDPNGVIQWKGQYHLFYQYNPTGPLWGNIHWGHAVSPDLIHWNDLPVALAPTPGGADEAGCFSGCAVVAGSPTLIYTGTRGERYEIQTQCVATSQDDLLTWEKYPSNPVLADVPEEARQTRDFRDPFVWKEGDLWYMALGSRIEDVGGAVFLYRSSDLHRWEYLNPLMIGDIKRNGVIWECPNFFKLGDQWVLIISSHTGTSTDIVRYFVGTYENFHFTPNHEGVLEYGHLYAPLTMLDDQNRRILFGWLREARSTDDQRRAGWSGVQSIPREVKLDAAGRLTTQPVAALEALRGKQHTITPSASSNTRVDIDSLALDIEAEFKPGESGSCGLSLSYLPSGSERTEIVYDASTQHLMIRKISPETSDAIMTHIREVPHALAAGESLKLRVLVDGSVIELIANGRTGVTSRVYPAETEGISVQVTGQTASLVSLNLWEMPSIWA